MRAGCATELFQVTRDVSLVQWQLRHENMSTLRHYIQELPLAMTRAALSETELAVVRRFSRAAGRLREDAVAGRGPQPLRAVALGGGAGPSAGTVCAATSIARAD